jgi:hypothetical protein
LARNFAAAGQFFLRAIHSFFNTNKIVGDLLVKRLLKSREKAPQKHHWPSKKEGFTASQKKIRIHATK